jgi:hypothetical protein
MRQHLNNIRKKRPKWKVGTSCPKGNRLCQPLSAVKQGCSKRVHIYVSIGQRPRMETVAERLKWQKVAECLKWQTVAERLKWQHRVAE